MLLVASCYMETGVSCKWLGHGQWASVQALLYLMDEHQK